MKIIIGSDHGGFEIKQEVKYFLVKSGHDVKDVGCSDTASCDYPDYASIVARGVSAEDFERGILVCGSGIGMSITANKFKKIRAALVCNVETARLSREHNDSNILCLPGRFLEASEAVRIVKVWMDATFSGERHARRLDKIKNLEKELLK